MSEDHLLAQFVHFSVANAWNDKDPLSPLSLSLSLSLALSLSHSLSLTPTLTWLGLPEHSKIRVEHRIVDDLLLLRELSTGRERGGDVRGCKETHIGLHTLD